MCTTKQEEASSEQETKSSLIKANSDADSNQKIPLNAGGVVRYYQDFVFSFLSELNLIVTENRLFVINQAFYLNLDLFFKGFVARRSKQH